MAVPKRIVPFLLILSGAIALLIPAFLNTYPFVFSDTGAYIACGFDGSVPMDRPAIYGIFVRHSSLSDSLWYTVLAQALLVSFVLFSLCSSLFIQPNQRNKVFLVLMAVLSFASSLPWFTSYVMADFFTAIVFLLLLLLLLKDHWNWFQKALLLLAFCFFSGAHFTHAPALLFMGLGILVLKFLGLPLLKKLPWKKVFVGLSVIMLNFLVLPFVHFLLDGRFEGARSQHVFLLARNNENGALKALLNDSCATHPYILCDYKDSLPASAPEFLWNENSPFNRLGGWRAHVEEYKEINKVIFTQPKYLKIYLSHFLSSLWVNLQMHETGEEFMPYGRETPPGWEIFAHFRKEIDTFLNAGQAKNSWRTFLNGFNYWLIGIWLFSLSVVLFYIFYKPGFYALRIISVALFLFYLGNALAVTIASGGSRYLTRTDWLFPALCVLILANEFWLGSNAHKKGENQ